MRRRSSDSAAYIVIIAEDESMRSSEYRKGCESMLQIDQIRYELGGVKSSLAELGESL